MGVEKAALIWKGRPLWEHQLDLARQIGAAETLISGSIDGPFQTSARVIPDETPACGPLGGVVSMLAVMKSEQLMVVAVDMPWLEASTLKLLLAEAREGRGVVPIGAHGIEPLAAVYPREILGPARKILISEDHSMHVLVQQALMLGLVRLLHVGAEHACRLRSVNTPAEWLAATAPESESGSKHTPG